MARKYTSHIIIHYSAKTLQPDGKPVDARTIDRWHRANGWLGIGYHRVIERDGRVVQGRADEAVGAHTLSYNHCGFGICVVGELAHDQGSAPWPDFTPEQWAALETLVIEMSNRWPQARVCGHRDLNATLCPGFDVGAWWTGLQAQHAL